MIPGPRRRLLLPSIAASLVVAALLAPASAFAAGPARGSKSLAREDAIATNRTITVDGVRLAVPRPGMGVGASILGRDGRSTVISVRTDEAGAVHVTTDAPAAAAAIRSESAALAVPNAETTAVLPACTDRKFTRTGSSWASTFRWSFKSDSTPSYLAVNGGLALVESTLKRAVGNITHERNDCKRTDHISARAVYAGRTTRGTHIGSDASCRRTDGANVIAFGTLPASTLGYTCWWIIGSRTIEADTVLNTDKFNFAVTTTSCQGAYMLEGVATHEFGHVFGLGHVSQAKHANLTMSPQIYPCDNSDATLGLGDMLGLESLY